MRLLELLDSNLEHPKKFGMLPCRSHFQSIPNVLFRGWQIHTFSMGDPIADLTDRMWLLEHQFHSLGNSTGAPSALANPGAAAAPDLGAIDAQLSDLKAELTAQITKVRTDSFTHSQQLADRLSALERGGDVASLTRTVPQLQASVDRALTQLADLKNDVHRQISDLRGDVNHQISDARSEALSRRLPDDRPPTASDPGLSSAVAQLQASLSQLTGEIGDVRADSSSRLQRLEGGLAALDHRADVADQELRASIGRLTQIEGNIDSLRNSVDSIKIPSIPSDPPPRPPPSPNPSPSPLKVPTPSPSPVKVPTPSPSPEKVPTPSPSPVKVPTPSPSPAKGPVPFPRPSERGVTLPPGTSRPVIPAPAGPEVKIDFDDIEDHRLVGIIRHLQQTKPPGVVTVSAFEATAQFAPENVIALDSPAYFRSKDKKDQWIKWDFHEFRVKPTAYTIQSANCGIYRKSWIIAGSDVGTDDDAAWTKIDERKEYNNLKGADIVQAFKVETRQTRSWRFIRLKLTARNHSQSNEIVIKAFEIFGTLTEPAA
jgi:hypothetical protein